MTLSICYRRCEYILFLIPKIKSLPRPPSQLLCVHPGARISTQQELHQTPLLRPMDFQAVLEKKIKPIFKPPEDHLNCDPCLELEEMIVETRPLHKKKKRLAKQRSAQRDSDPETTLIKEFIVYNRFKELKRKAMEQKESDWQRELEFAMANSIVNSLAPIQEKPTTSLATMDSATTTALNACVRCTTTTAQKKQQPKDSDSIEFIDRTPSPQAAVVTPTPRRFCCKATSTARE